MRCCTRKMPMGTMPERECSLCQRYGSRRRPCGLVVSFVAGTAVAIKSVPFVRLTGLVYLGGGECKMICYDGIDKRC